MSEIFKIEWGPIIAAVITSSVTLIGFLISVSVNARNMKQILDGSSEWRKSLFRACSKEKIDMNDVHLLRTSLRYIKNPSNPTELSFNWFTNQSISFCNDLIASDYSKKKFKLNYDNEEIVRLIIRCLLKNHWEYSNRFYTKKDKMNAKPNEIVKETAVYINGFTTEYFKFEGSKTPNPEDNKGINRKDLIFKKLEGEYNKLNSNEKSSKDKDQVYLFILIVISFLILVRFFL